MLAAVAGACLIMSNTNPAHAAEEGLAELAPAEQNRVLEDAGLDQDDVARERALENLSEATDTSFYAAPAQLPANNGDLVRQEPRPLSTWTRSSSSSPMPRPHGSCTDPPTVTGRRWAPPVRYWPPRRSGGKRDLAHSWCSRREPRVWVTTVHPPAKWRWAWSTKGFHSPA